MTQRLTQKTGAQMIDQLDSERPSRAARRRMMVSDMESGIAAPADFATQEVTLDDTTSAPDTTTTVETVTPDTTTTQDGHDMTTDETTTTTADADAAPATEPTATLPKGHVIEDGIELKRCPGVPHVPAGSDPHQTHFAPLSDFGKNQKHADGLTRVCKPGWALYAKALSDMKKAEKPAAVEPAAAVETAADAAPAPAVKKARTARAPRPTKKSVAEAIKQQVRRESGRKPRARKQSAAAAATVETAEEAVAQG